MVAGLVAKLVLFPAGTLASVPLWVRGVAVLGAVLFYLAGRRSLAVGVAAAAGLIITLELARAVW